MPGTQDMLNTCLLLYPKMRLGKPWWTKKQEAIKIVTHGNVQFGLFSVLWMRIAGHGECCLIRGVSQALPKEGAVYSRPHGNTLYTAIGIHFLSFTSASLRTWIHSSFSLCPHLPLLPGPTLQISRWPAWVRPHEQWPNLSWFQLCVCQEGIFMAAA